MEGLFRFTFGEDTRTLHSVFITKQTLQYALYQHKATQGSNLFHSLNVEIRSDLLYRIFGALDSNGDAELKKFVDAVRPYYDECVATIETMLIKQRVRFWDLWYVFQRATKVVMTRRDVPVGALVESTTFHTSFFGTVCGVKLSFVQTDGTKFGQASTNIYVSEYEGTKSLTKLPLQLLGTSSKSERARRLTARGKVFVSLALKASHLYYDGVTYKEAWPAPIQTHVRGRVVVDVRAYKEYDSNDDVFKLASNNNNTIGAYDDGGDDDGDGDVAKASLDEKHYWMTWPALPAFCLSTKQWGEVIVDQLQPIEFRTDAFTQLVLDDSVKLTIRSIVEMQMEHKDALFGDIIADKGNGAIFLLHGPPGVGKTSSAEAIAEERQCPLYSITVGELGTNPEQLEKRLQRLLATAARWNAVILLDEADVFLERRSAADVMRNAMVSIFLRLLEYHTGVLFMTTNRVTAFDEAFLSRIGVGLIYHDFDTNKRGLVWRALLQAAQLDSMYDESLAQHALNGRQIRTIIRLASAVAMKQQRPLALTDLEATIKLTTDFAEHMKGEK